MIGAMAIGSRKNISTLAGLTAALRDSAVVVVDFWAASCMPCHTLDLRLTRLQLEGLDFALLKVNVECAPEVAREFGVMTVPTLLRFTGEQLTGRLSELWSQRDLGRWIVGGEDYGTKAQTG